MRELVLTAIVGLLVICVVQIKFTQDALVEQVARVTYEAHEARLDADLTRLGF